MSTFYYNGDEVDADDINRVFALTQPIDNTLANLVGDSRFEIDPITNGLKAMYLKGATGDTPAHQWQNTSIRFQNPDGTWGAYVDLVGTIANAPPRTITHVIGFSSDCDTILNPTATNHHTTINNVITSVNNAGGGTILFRAGTYNAGNSILLSTGTSNISLV